MTAPTETRPDGTMIWEGVDVAALQARVVELEGQLAGMRTGAVGWVPDHDDPNSVDDFTAHNVKTVRFERMDNGAYWFCVYMHDGTQFDFDFGIVKGKRRINVFARQGQP